MGKGWVKLGGLGMGSLLFSVTLRSPMVGSLGLLLFLTLCRVLSKQTHNPTAQNDRHPCDMTVPWVISLRSLFRVQVWRSGSPSRVTWSLVHFGSCGLLSEHQFGAAASPLRPRPLLFLALRHLHDPSSREPHFFRPRRTSERSFC